MNHSSSLASRLMLAIGFLLLSSALVAGMVEGQAAPSIDLKEVPPPTAAPNGKITIQWDVKDSGKIAHTAVHWDTKPGNPADFKSYAKASPDFASLDPAQAAPKEYKVTFDAPSSGTLYYVVHAIVDGKNVYNPDGERKIVILGTPGLGLPGQPPAIGGGPQAPAPAGGDSSPQRQYGGGIYGGGGGPDTSLLLGIGAVIVVIVIAGVAIRRRNRG